MTLLPLKEKSKNNGSFFHDSGSTVNDVPSIATWVELEKRLFRTSIVGPLLVSVSGHYMHACVCARACALLELVLVFLQSFSLLRERTNGILENS